MRKIPRTAKLDEVVVGPHVSLFSEKANVKWSQGENGQLSFKISNFLDFSSNISAPLSKQLFEKLRSTSRPLVPTTFV